MNEKGDGPYRGFGYLSLFSDPVDITVVLQLSKRIVDKKTVIIQIGPNILNIC